MWHRNAFAVVVPILLAVMTGSVRCSEPTLQELLKQKPDEQDRRNSIPCEAVKYFLEYYHGGPQLRQEFRDGHYTYAEEKALGKVRVHVENHVFVISWFQRDGTTALRYTVNDAGCVYYVRHVHNWALQGGHHDKQLDQAQLKALHQLLLQLPKSTAEPQINRTVYVSFADKDGWRSETYDTERLPDEFEAVMEIVGDPFETRGRKTAKPK